MKIEKEVRGCDACDSLFTIWWDGEKDDGPDYKVTYLDKALDLCPNCYSQITSIIERRKIRLSAI